jgi:hypothetical protein
MNTNYNNVNIGKERCFVLTWNDDDIHVEYRLRDTSQDAYDRLTSTLGKPTCKLKDYSFMIW